MCHSFVPYMTLHYFIFSSHLFVLWFNSFVSFFNYLNLKYIRCRHDIFFFFLKILYIYIFDFGESIKGNGVWWGRTINKRGVWRNETFFPILPLSLIKERWTLLSLLQTTNLLIIIIIIGQFQSPPRGRFF